MTIQEAIKKRHMVRQYTDKPIPANIVELLNERITENNKKYDLNLVLVTGRRWNSEIAACKEFEKLLCSCWPRYAGIR